MKRHWNAAGATAAVCFAVTIAATVCIDVSSAGPTEDGNAGLEAMNRGDYATAEKLFAAVIKAKDLAPEDKQYAYFDLGLIQLRQGRYPEAVANLETAAKLNPDDSEAQSQLELAQAGKNGADPLQVRWGGLRLLDGGTWVAATSHEDRKHVQKDDPFFYATYSWRTRGEVLAFTGKDQTGGAVSGTLSRDPATGVITEDMTDNGTASSGYVEPTLNGYVETLNDGATRVTVKQVDATTFNVVLETYANNAWTQTKSYRLLQSPALARDMDKKALGRRLKSCIGASAKAGLLSALTGQQAQTPAECGGSQPQGDDQQ